MFECLCAAVREEELDSLGLLAPFQKKQVFLDLVATSVCGAVSSEQCRVVMSRCVGW